MAFKASRPARPSAKKPESPEPPSAGSFSVDDLIGLPAGEAGEPVKQESGISNQESGEKKQTDPSSSMIHNSKFMIRGDRPMGYAPRRQGGGYTGNRPGFRRDFGHNRGGYRPGGGYQSRNGDNGGFIQHHSDSVGFTQDVDVPTETVRGVLDTLPEGHGFLRPKYTPSEKDIYISLSQIRRFLLRNGDMVEGQARPPKDNERFWGLLKVEKINEQPAEEMVARPKFEDLVPVYPNMQLKLEIADLPTGGPLSMRIVDLVAPIGFGQRGLVVSAPKAGKTTILKELAAGISANYPEVHLMAALIGERPEEVTDISRSVHGEVFASNFDESPAEQTRIAEVALDRAKRLVEMGKDVVILLDSITRLARAYNLVVNPSGRTLSGGFDPAALYPAKKFLGAARCVEPVADALVSKGTKRYTTGGSLTVIGTALVETGSRMDDLIYEEFKGTGNMELHLSRALQERRIFPALDIVKSGTRHDELLLGEEMMKRVATLRHMLSLLGDEERTMMMIDRLGKTKNNLEFLDSLGKG